MILKKRNIHRFNLLQCMALGWVMLLVAPQASACNIYVSSVDGDDGNPGSASLPFKTIQAAAEVAITPGDTVCVKPGVYFENSQATPNTAVKGVKVQASGTPGLPITFQADPEAVGAVIIDMGFDRSMAPGATFNPSEAVGFYIRAFDYVTIRGFEIRNVTTGILTQALNSPQAPNLGEFDPPSNIIIEQNHIHDVRKDQRLPSFDSNIAPVRSNDCYDCEIRGNRLHGVSILDNDGNEVFINQNSAGVHSFGMLRTTIENNEIYDAHTGVFQKAWTGQPLPGDSNFDPAKIPPPIDPAVDFGVKVRRNLIHDTVLGVRLSPSGGNGRQMSATKSNGNPAHYNAEIYENIFYSTAVGAQRLGSNYARMEWALQTDLRGTVSQSEGLKFFNNTVMTHNGVTIDAVSGVQIYNNFFSLSEVTASGISGPEIAIQTNYTRFRAIQSLNGGTDINLGTPALPVRIVAAAGCQALSSCDCNLGVDPDLTDNGGTSPVSTPPFAALGDIQFYCDDNIQWTAEITLSDFNYYHVGKNFRLNRYGSGGNGVQSAGVEQLLSSLVAWQGLTAGGDNVGLADDSPDSSSQSDLAPQADFITGVTINENVGVTIDPSQTTPFLHPATLDGAGRTDGLEAGAAVNIGAFPSGVFDPNSGAFDPASDSGFVGLPRLVGAPGDVTVDEESLHPSILKTVKISIQNKSN